MALRWIGDVHVFDAVSGGDALLVLDVGDLDALVVFERRARREQQKVRVFDPFAGGAELVVLEGHTEEYKRFDSLHRPGNGRAAAR